MIKIGPRTRKVVQEIEKYAVPGTFCYPLSIKDGKGSYIQDLDDNWFLDFNSQVCSCPLGYRHPELMKVLEHYSKIGAHKIAGQDFYSEEHARLAKKLIDITPDSMTKAFLINTGAEAVENAIKFAYRRVGPRAGVGFEMAFHGRTLGALTYTCSKPVQKKNYPQLKHFRLKFCTHENDEHIDDIEKLAREHKLAYVIVEPIQGEGGYRPAAQRFMKKLREVSKKHDFAMICDEVQTGIGRTGKWWGFENYDIVPDIISSAKALQVGATISNSKWATTEPGAVSSTWGGGHRIDMAIGLKTIEIMERDKILKKVQVDGKYVYDLLFEVKNKYPKKIIDVRGLGFMIGVEFADKSMRDKIVDLAFRNGLSMIGCGHQAIRIAPPLNIERKDLDNGLQIFYNCIKEV